MQRPADRRSQRVALNRIADRLLALRPALVPPRVLHDVIAFRPSSFPEPAVFVPRRVALLLAALAFSVPPVLCGQTTGSGYSTVTLTPAQTTADLALLRRALQDIHAGCDRYTPRRVMNTAFARIGRKAAAPMTNVAFCGEVALLLAKIRCNHTKAEYPAPRQAFRESVATHLPPCTCGASMAGSSSR